ncbi:MAG: DUF1810 domain-containing protein [Acetobacteraceae bacterium]
MTDLGTDAYDLGRFVAAQDATIDRVRVELGTGRKVSHWMWFIFPQIAGLGHSETARFFAIRSKEEAAAYLAHPLLGPRLVECTKLMNGIARATAEQILGAVDAMKFHSCMTLFAATDPGQPDFTEALRKYFGGAVDQATLDLIRSDI